MLLSATLAYSYFLQLSFSADGAFYFASIIDNGRFMVPGKARWNADIAFQWPVVLAVRSGVSDLRALEIFFSIGLYFPFAASFLLSAYALRDMDRNALVFPLLGYVLVSLPASYIWVGESHVMACATWPVLFLLLRPSLSRGDAGLLVGLLAFLSLSYETVVVPGVIFAVILVVRLLRSSGRQRTFYSLSVLVCLLVIAIAAYSIAVPRSPRNQASFIIGLKGPLLHPSFLCGIVAVAFLALTGLTRRAWPIVIALAAAATSLVLPSLGYTARAPVSFFCRTLTLTLLPLLLVAAAAWVLGRPKLDRLQAAATTVVLAVLLLGNALSWGEWSRFRDDFREALRANSGYVAVEQTPLLYDSQRWGWTSPLLSILWSDGCVRTVIGNEAGIPWEPFDPRQRLPLQRHFAFADAFRAAAPDAVECE